MAKSKLNGNEILNMLTALKQSEITSYVELARLFKNKERGKGGPDSLTDLFGPYPNYFTQSFNTNYATESELYIFDKKEKYLKQNTKKGPVIDFGIYKFERNPYYAEDEGNPPYELIALDSLYFSILDATTEETKDENVWQIEGETTDWRGNKREMLEYALNKQILYEPWNNEGVGGIKAFFSPGNLYVITYDDFMSLMKNMPRFINWTKTKPFK